MKHPGVAFGLLVFGLACSYGWYWASPDMAADVQNILAAAFIFGLLALFGLVFDSAEIWLVTALLGLLKASVIACNTWYVIAPWPVMPGAPLCSTRLDLPLWIVGLVLGMVLAAYLLWKHQGGHDG
ncbi:hypothetical protein [Rhizobacter sp. SG703]|uniref:hypothetical protein n=1 Tax=Rhizobacter sp. SG703 TaxID=2587140 RepID=UPI001447319F|nr:hypothetical protein [Rhizobacter sp. SG703]NKI94791.1 hypothetical protein [Rhizobacter sp. SG703]